MKGKVMAVINYRTKDGLADYEFSIEFHRDGGWRICIIFDPACKGQNDTPQFPYEFLDEDGRLYVEWSRLASLGDAKRLPNFWSSLFAAANAHKENVTYVES
jgi:hypothetical protein